MGDSRRLDGRRGGLDDDEDGNDMPRGDRHCTMIGRVFAILCALSLAVCVLAAFLWVRGNWVYDNFELAVARRSRWPARVYMATVESCQGRFRVRGTVYEDDPDNADVSTRSDSPPWVWRHHSDREALELELDHVSADGYEHEVMQYTYGEFRWTTAVIPQWRVVVWTGVLPLVWGVMRVGRWIGGRGGRGRFEVARVAATTQGNAD